MPQPTYKNLRDFCRIDGWDDISKKRLGRKGKGLDHDRYEKRLDDGGILRTKVSHGSGQYGDPGLWRHIWRDQLGLDSEEQFWEALRTGEPVERAVAAEAPPSKPAIPGWLLSRLVFTVGIPEEEVNQMTLEEADARWTEFMSSPRLDSS
ncbi:MAG: cytotoxic translational repressor of toxin-antitoxin stability system [Gaiellaceae bacterium]